MGKRLGLSTFLTASHVRVEDFVVFQTIFDSSLKILHNHLPISSRTSTDTMSALHRLFGSFDPFPHDRILDWQQGTNKTLIERTMPTLFN